MHCQQPLDLRHLIHRNRRVEELWHLRPVFGLYHRVKWHSNGRATLVDLRSSAEQARELRPSERPEIYGGVVVPNRRVCEVPVYAPDGAGWLGGFPLSASVSTPFRA